MASRPFAQERYHVLQHLWKREGADLQVQPARLDLGEIKDVVDQGEQMAPRGADVGNVLRLLVVEFTEEAAFQHLGEPDHGIERGA